MNQREKKMLIITLILLVILFSKSLFFDEVKNLTTDELKFKQFVKKVVDENKNHNGFLKQLGIVSYKIIKVQKTEEESESYIKYWNEEEKRYKKAKFKGKYRAKVRGYFLHLFPYKQFSVESVLQHK